MKLYFMTFLTLNEVVEIFMKKKLFEDKNSPAQN